MKEEIIIINGEPFYRIPNVTSFDYAPIPKEFKPYFEKLQEENKYLQSKLKAKEEVIKEAREYIEHTYKDYKNEDGSLPLTLHDQELLEILDKENTNEETN